MECDSAARPAGVPRILSRTLLGREGETLVNRPEHLVDALRVNAKSFGEFAGAEPTILGQHVDGSAEERRLLRWPNIAWFVRSPPALRQRDHCAPMRLRGQQPKRLRAVEKVGHGHAERPFQVEKVRPVACAGRSTRQEVGHDMRGHEHRAGEGLSLVLKDLVAWFRIVVKD
jgi:hypothetical protein